MLPLGFAFACLLVFEESPGLRHSDESPRPAIGATDVSPLTAVRAEFTAPVDPSSLTGRTFRLLDARDRPVPAEINCDLTGGVATLTPVQQLAEDQLYRVVLSDGIRGQNGGRFRPTEWTFRTGRQRIAGPKFAFSATEIDRRDQVTTVRLGPDGCLYTADVHGSIHRYRLGPNGRPTARELAATLSGRQIIHLTFDPRATAEQPLLWISHAGRRAGPWAGTISRMIISANLDDTGRGVQDVIVGLPCPENLEHQPNHLAFGPDGRLYQSVGGVATLGGSPNWGAAESRLSAAVIVADLRHPAFADDRLPCDVTTGGPIPYDPLRPDAPVQIYATGLRNAVGLCWTSGGHLFAATNGNSIGAGVTTPATDGVPAITATPHEALCRILPGNYYGHPNPSRGEFVLLGGNPTAAVDPWEVPAYPVGVQPDPKFQPRLLYDLRPGGGNSANGLCEYRGPGPLQGRLLAAYFSGGRCVQTFAIDAQGDVTDERPLVGADGRVLRFNQPLDLCCDPANGRIYLAVFGNWRGNQVGSGVESSGGGVWMLEPIPATD